MTDSSHSVLDEATGAEAAFDRLVCGVVAKLEVGERVDLSAIAADFPELAERLAPLLPALEAMATLHADETGLSSDFISQSLGRANESGLGRAPDAMLGDFRIVREIGRGGMGVVYEAEQASLGRRVALKVLPFAAMLGEQQLQRFKNEARAAATLKHPHIVSVYSVGCDRGVHYYAMELVNGESLDRALIKLRKADCGLRNEECGVRSSEPGGLPPRPGSETTRLAAISNQQSQIPNPKSQIDTAPVAALSPSGESDSPAYFRNLARLGIEAADALEHAHQLGIIHRDIKPANLLVDNAGKLWITDFGLARIEADVGLTMTGDMLGTLRYMSPEQVLGQGVADHRADVYSLGATLYELATLEPAYRATNRKQLLHEIATTDPRPPRQINRKIPGDLDTIIRKAIERDAVDRYASAKELADDLRRFLASEPIRAKPASMSMRLMKWSRRHHTLVASTGLLAVLLATILAVGSVLIERSRTRAEIALVDSAHHQERLADLLYAADIRLAFEAWEDNDLPRAMELLQQQVPPDGGIDRRDVEWHFLRKLCTSKFELLASVDSAIYDFAFSPDGTQLAAVGKDAMLRVYDPRSRQLLTQINTSQTEVNGVAFFPNGQTLATTGDDGTVRLWHNLRQPAQTTIQAHDGIAYDIVYSQDADCLISCGEDSKIQLWNPQSGESLGTLSGHTAAVTALAVSHNGRLLASASRDHTVRIWDLQTRQELHQIQRLSRATSLAFDRQDQMLVIGVLANFEDHMLVVRLDTWQTTSIPIPVKQADSVAISPDGRLLVAGTDGGVIWAWELDNISISTDPYHRNLTWSAHNGTIYQLAFTPDGHSLLSAGEDGNLRIWENPQKRLAVGQLEVLGRVQGIAPIGHQPLLAVAGTKGVAIFHLLTGELVEQIADGSAPYRHINVSADGKRVAAIQASSTISVWDLNSPAPRTATTYRPIPANRAIFSPDGATLAVYGQTTDDGLVQIDLDTGQTRSGFVAHGCNAFAWSPDGRFHAAAENHTDAILIHDRATGQLIHRLKLHQSSTHNLAISPNSRWVASADDDRLVALWDAKGGELQWSGTTSAATSTRGYPTSIVFAPSGKSLWILSSEGTIAVLHVATGRELLQFDQSWGAAETLALSGGGKFLCLVHGGLLRVIETGFAAPAQILGRSR